MNTHEDDFEDLEDDDWTVADMTVGDYRRMAKRIEDQGREVYSIEELARFDEAAAEMSVMGSRVWESVQRLLPDTGEAVRQVRDSYRKYWSDRGLPRTTSLLNAQQSLPPPSPVSNHVVEALAERASEQRTREDQQITALESIVGHMAEMKEEQRKTTTELGGQREDDRKSGRWNLGLTVVGAAAGVVAAVFAVLVYLNPPT